MCVLRGGRSGILLMLHQVPIHSVISSSLVGKFMLMCRISPAPLLSSDGPYTVLVSPFNHFINLLNGSIEKARQQLLESQKAINLVVCLYYRTRVLHSPIGLMSPHLIVGLLIRQELDLLSVLDPLFCIFLSLHQSIFADKNDRVYLNIRSMTSF